MAQSIVGKKISDIFRDWLRVDNNNSGISATLQKVVDGNGNESALQIAESKVVVKPSSDNPNAFEVQDSAGSVIFTIDLVNNQVIAGTGVKFVGDGSSLSGITGATGGVSNIGTTNIEADTDLDGTGVINLTVKGVTVMTIENDGSVTYPSGTEFKTKIGNVTFLKATSQAKAWLSANGFPYADELIIPHPVLANNYAIFDQNYNGHWMVEIPRKNWDSINLFASSTIHPAFTVQGTQKRIFIGKYQASLNSAGQYVTHANNNAKQTINFDSADAAAQALNNGSSITGFHMMSNAEWALVALISKYLNTMPGGNNNYGRDIGDKFITGVLEAGYEANFGSTSPARWLAGSGGVKTSHDGTAAGIFDLNGNVWEWVRGLRLQSGEIQILADNDAAANLDVSATSLEWKAIDASTGNLVAPGTAGTLKYDSVNPGTTGNVGAAQLDDVIDNSNDPGTGDDGYTYTTFESLAADVGITAPEILKSLALFPYTTGLGSDGMWVRNYGERLPIRGGAWGYGAYAGVFSLSLNNPRSGASSYIGCRLAFAL